MRVTYTREFDFWGKIIVGIWFAYAVIDCITVGKLVGCHTIWKFFVYL